MKVCIWCNDSLDIDENGTGHTRFDTIQVPIIPKEEK